MTSRPSWNSSDANERVPPHRQVGGRRHQQPHRSAPAGLGRVDEQRALARLAPSQLAWAQPGVHAPGLNGHRSGSAKRPAEDRALVSRGRRRADADAPGITGSFARTLCSTHPGETPNRDRPRSPSARGAMARRVHPQALDRHRLLVADQAGSGHIIGYKDLADLFIAIQRHTLRTGPRVSRASGRSRAGHRLTLTLEDHRRGSSTIRTTSATNVGSTPRASHAPRPGSTKGVACRHGRPGRMCDVAAGRRVRYHCCAETKPPAPGKTPRPTSPRHRLPWSDTDALMVVGRRPAT